MRNSRKSSPFILLGLFLGIGLFIAGLGTLYVLSQGNDQGEPRSVVIQRGTSLGQVAELLHKEKVITNPKLFKFLMRLSGGEKKVRAGEFNFQTHMRFTSALRTLYYSEPVVHSITVPEGWTIRQISQVIENAGLGKAERFNAYALSRTAAEKYKLKTPHLEGFLFPDTYDFSKIDGEERIVDRMVQRFFQKFTKEHIEEAKLKGFSLEEIVTLASIIEKETGVTTERELVSSVFNNRLKKKMRLQSDPTTIYGIMDFNGNLTKANLLQPSPYNTYTLPALPLGPIASPGLDSLLAAIRPANTEYLYFVANNQGQHIFSKTYAEHAQHVYATQGPRRKPMNEEPEREPARKAPPKKIARTPQSKSTGARAQGKQNGKEKSRRK